MENESLETMKENAWNSIMPRRKMHKDKKLGSLQLCKMLGYSGKNL